MSDTVTISLIGMIGSLLAAIVGLLNNVIARKNASDIEKTKHAMQDLHRETNSMKDALVTATGQGEFARGMLEGKALGRSQGVRHAAEVEAARREIPPKGVE